MMVDFKKQLNYVMTLLTWLDDNLSLALYSNNAKIIHDSLCNFHAYFADDIDEIYHYFPAAFTVVNNYEEYLLAGGWRGPGWDSRVTDFMKQMKEENGEGSEEYLLVKRYFDERLSFILDLF